MVHDALFYRPDIEVFADELEKAIEDVLRKMVGDVVRQQPACVTMEELVEWYQEPWS